jgi:hypothetical protein
MLVPGAWNWPLAIWRARSLTLTNMVMGRASADGYGWRGSGVDGVGL